MSKEVNLISSRRQESSAAYKQLGVIRVISFFTLGLCILVALLLFWVNSLSQVSELAQKESQLNNTLLQGKNKIVKIALIKDRLTSIKNLTSTSSQYESTIDILSNALPRDCTFDAFEISQTKVSLVVSSSSLLSINTFTDYIINSVNNKKTFQKVTINSLVGDLQSGKYTLNMDLILL